MKHSNDQDEVDDIDDIGDPENIPPLNLYYCNAMKIKTSNFNFANIAIHLQLHMTTGTKYKGSMFFMGPKFDNCLRLSVIDRFTDSLTVF